jgi:glutamate-1-semialdehyde 2,1-aminomutase
LAEGIRDTAHRNNIPMSINVAGSMFGLFFTDVEHVTNYKQAINCNTAQFNQFYHAMLNEGVYFAPASYEAGFVSKMHTIDVVDATIEAADRAFKQITAK